MGELIVKYGNEVNRAARRLTTSELRILFVAIAKNFQVKDRCLECRVSAQELISLGSDPSTAYADLRQAVETLFDRYIVFTEKDASDNALIERKIRWVQDIGYVKGSGEVVVTLSQKLLPFLHDFRLFQLRSQPVDCNLIGVESAEDTYRQNIFISKDLHDHIAVPGNRF